MCMDDVMLFHLLSHATRVFAFVQLKHLMYLKTDASLFLEGLMTLILIMRVMTYIRSQHDARSPHKEPLMGAHVHGQMECTEELLCLVKRLQVTSVTVTVTSECFHIHCISCRVFLYLLFCAVLFFPHWLWLYPPVSF